MTTLTADLDQRQQDEIWAAAIGGAPGVEITYPSYEPALMAAWVARATTDALTIALDGSCAPYSVDALFQAFTPAQVQTIKQHRLQADVALTRELDIIIARRRRFYFLMRTTITANEWSALATLDDSRIVEPGRTAMSRDYPGLRARLANVATGVRAWLAPANEEDASLFSPGADRTNALLWAATLPGPDDESIRLVAKQLDRLRPTFSSQAARDHTADQLARVLVETLTPHEVLDALRSRSKDRSVLDMYDRASARLRAYLGPPVDFVELEPAAAAAFLLAHGDARKHIARALVDADAARTFAILRATAWYLPGAYQDMLGPDGWSWIRRILVQLDRVMAASIGGSELPKIWKLIQAGLTTSKHASKPLEVAVLGAELRALHDASSNPHFRTLTDTVLSPPPAVSPAPSGPRTYAPSAKYAVGEAIDHPTFGRGTVKASTPGKVQVEFASGVRVLAQAR